MTFNNSSYQSLIHLQTVCLKQNIPFVSYRLPLDTEIITLVQHHSLPEKLDSIQNIDTKIGFVVAPFDKDAEHGTYFLEPDSVFFSNNIEDIYIQKLSENNLQWGSVMGGSERARESLSAWVSRSHPDVQASGLAA
jgi:hypothetical protein